MTPAHEASARLFRQLHQDGLLLLANAWDAGSARLIESLGARAVATTSAGVAWCHGYPDGDALPTRLLLATVAEIARAVRVPLTVDVEGGYSSEAARVGETVAAVVDAGAVGINLEDGTGDPDALCAKLESAKRASANRGVELFVNARTDVYLRGLVPRERRIEETLARARRYRAAGADGLFVPLLSEPDDIRAIAGDAGMPLNVMAVPALPPAVELAALGVRRLSAGSFVAQSALATVASLATAFLRDGSLAATSEPMGYPAINALMR